MILHNIVTQLLLQPYLKPCSMHPKLHDFEMISLIVSKSLKFWVPQKKNVKLQNYIYLQINIFKLSQFTATKPYLTFKLINHHHANAKH